MTNTIIIVGLRYYHGTEESVSFNLGFDGKRALCQERDFDVKKKNQAWSWSRGVPSHFSMNPQHFIYFLFLLSCQLEEYLIDNICNSDE
jgi:hypothetical protein